MSEFKEGEVHILTLKDTSVLDGDSLNDGTHDLSIATSFDMNATRC